MQSHHSLRPEDVTLDLGSKALGMIVPGLIMAVVGGVVAYVCGLHSSETRTLFYHAYLVAFVFYLTITLGSLFFVMLHHLARSGWSVTLRRLAEALSGNIFLLAVLFVPIVFGLSDIYTWAEKQPAQSATGTEKTKSKKEGKADTRAPQKFMDAALAAEPASIANKSAQEKPGDNIAENAAENGKEKPAAKHSQVKHGEEGSEEDAQGAVVGHRYWLTPNGFKGRFAIYFVIWFFLVWYFRGHSILQDTTGSLKLTRSMERTAAPGMILFAFTLTLAAVDLIMSLNPHWFSTMIGVYLFADAVLSSLVAITLLALGLQSCGLLRGAVTVEHYHDLGKLTFGFVVFWAYIAFSQYMLIWYANIPEETQFYMPRQIGAWAAVSLTLIIVHFVLPFAGLMSRHVKRTLPLFAFWLIWLLVAHAFDIFWLIMPNYFIRQMPANKSLPDVFKTLLESQQSVYQLAPGHQSFMDVVNAPLAPGAIATVIGLLMFMGGLYVAWTAWLLSAAALVPVKDPRLNESLNFHNV